MKFLLLSGLVLLSINSFAEEKCKDSNFNGLYAEHYSKLQYHSRFKKLFEGDSPAPAGFSEVFGAGDELCRDVTLTVLKHSNSEKTYFMYTTHDDYCDGGNTLGIIIDMEKHSELLTSLKDTIVGEIGDGEFYCN